MNYYAKFLPNLSSTLHPLHALLRDGQPWNWSKECERVFKEAKKKLTEAPVLSHYDPSLPIVMAADASAYGIGAVISHRHPDGTETPIAYASRTLTSAERNYAQVEKEALSLVFGIQKFHQYLYGRRFILLTDHKPLTTILGPKNGIPPLAAARMQRWALLLSAYSYDIQFRPTKKHANADGLSRLPLSDSIPLGNVPDPTMFNIAQLSCLPVTAKMIASATRTDPVLSKVLICLKEGWPQPVPGALLPFHRRCDCLSIEGECVMWGHRVVIPKKWQEKVLEELHVGHPGVVRMKSLARSHFWWPDLDKNIEECSKACPACQSTKNLPAKAPLHPWTWSSIPWERIHVDFAGPFLGKMFLVVVDAHSKWPEIIVMSSTTAARTITALRELFARNGIPNQLVSDNGPQFVLEELKQFLANNGVRHIRSSPYHPASNGAAERMVQTMKSALKAAHASGAELEKSLSAFLLGYRTTPHAVTGVSPSSLFMGRELRTRLRLLTPDLAARVRSKQLQQKEHHDRHCKEREISLGQSVWAKNFRSGPSWIQAVVIGKVGPVTYLVRLENGEEWRRHIDHLRSGSDIPAAEFPTENNNEDVPFDNVPSLSSPPQDVTQTTESASGETQHPNTTSSSADTSTAATKTAQRYPVRIRKPPDRLY